MSVSQALLVPGMGGGIVYPESLPTDDLEHWWRADNTDAVNDGDDVTNWSDSVGSVDYIAPASPYAVLDEDGIGGNPAVDYGSVTGYQQVASWPTGYSAGFIQTVVKTPSSFSTEQAIYLWTNSRGFYRMILGIDTSGKFFHETTDTGGVSTHRLTGDTVLSSDSNYILTVTNDGATKKLFVNGTDQTLSGTQATVWLAAAHSSYIGRGTYSEWFEGQIAEIALWSAYNSSNRELAESYATGRYLAA